MKDFKSLKARSGSKALNELTDKVNKAVTQESGKKNDDRFWTPTVDKAGNGYAIIRFLDDPPGEDVPFIRVFDHGFQGPGGWYIEKSLTTLGQADPVSEYNSRLWNSTTDDNSPERKQARAQKRRLHFISNIYVIQDQANPANEGKVFLFKYGKKIFDKLKEAMEPQFEDETPINPFDLWEGANFKLKIRNVEGYRNYDKSEFDKPGPLLNDEEELERIWKSEHSLQEFLSPSNFKTYQELKEKFEKVLSRNSDNTTRAENFEEASPPKFKTTTMPKIEEVSDDDGDDSIEFFRTLANS